MTEGNKFKAGQAEELQRLQPEVAAREDEMSWQRLRDELLSVLRYIPGNVAITRYADGKIVEANEAMQTELGYTRDELIGKTSTELGIWPDREDRVTFINAITETGHCDSLEVTLRTKDGRIIHHMVAGRVIEIGSEKYVYLVSNSIDERVALENDKIRLIEDLQQALAKVKALSGMLPICSGCKKIRDDKGYWNQIESYIRDHSEAEFSHGACPDCIERLYPDAIP